MHITDLLAGLGTMGLSWRLGVELGFQWTGDSVVCRLSQGWWLVLVLVLIADVCFRCSEGQ